MRVVIVVVGIGLLAGTAATAAAWRWSRADPTDPHLQRRTVRSFLGRHPFVRRLIREHPAAPETGTAEVLGLAAVSVVVGTAAAGVVFAMIRTGTGLARVDTPLAQWAARHASDASSEIIGLISELGGTAIVVAAALAVTGAELVRDRRWTVPAFVALTVGGQFALSNGIKLLVDRARPTLAPLTGFAGSSFPSGHSVAAAATWMCVAFLLGRGRRRHLRAALFGAAIGVAASVAATRVALGVHWTSDVVAGLFVGWVWFALCSIAFGGRVLRFGEPVEIAEDEAAAPERAAPLTTRR